MNQPDCAVSKDLLPAYLAGELSGDESEAVRSHLAACEDCRVEADLIERIRRTTPQPRAALGASVRDGIRSGSGGRAGGISRHWWIAAAATVVLSLGTGLVWQQMQGDPLPIMIAEQVDNDFWPGDETLLAGGLDWDDLSDEELTVLLEDWDDEA
jgi:anti-sigma factor RsiW